MRFHSTSLLEKGVFMNIDEMWNYAAEKEIKEDELNEILLFKELYYSPYSELGPIRDIFDNTSYEALKELYQKLIDIPTDEGALGEFELLCFGGDSKNSILMNADWTTINPSKILKLNKKTYKGKKFI